MEIEHVIKARLNMQSTQDKLIQEFNITLPSVNTLRHKRFVSLFNSWDDKKQNRFLSTIGGRVNIKHAKEYINGLSILN